MRFLSGSRLGGRLCWGNDVRCGKSPAVESVDHIVLCCELARRIPSAATTANNILEFVRQIQGPTSLPVKVKLNYGVAETTASWVIGLTPQGRFACISDQVYTCASSVTREGVAAQALGSCFRRRFAVSFCFVPFGFLLPYFAALYFFSL